MDSLFFPPFDYKVKQTGGKPFIFDIVRKKYVALTPEEWVRQHVVHFLSEVKGYPISLIAVEREINLFGLKRRFDIVCFDRKGDAALIVECKAPQIALTQQVFDQAFGYNHIVTASYVMITNGITVYCGIYIKGTGFVLQSDIPSFTLFM